MHSRKLLSYAIYTSSVVLLVYLLMTWMYFKDNTLQLTTPRLLLWFIIIPLSLFGFILITRRHRKDLDNKKTEIPLITDKEIEKEPIESYQLFINASICLPEGSSWSEIVDNKDDLTVLSEDLSDFDGLPILVKPIESVITEQYPLYHYQDSSNFASHELEVDADADNYASYDESDTYDDEEERPQSSDELTLRLCALVSEQLLLSNDFLSLLAQHFAYLEQDDDEPNSAIHIHPDWQPHYIAGANNRNNSSETNDEESRNDLPAQTLSQLSIYLCIPSLADTDFLLRFIKQQLADYGIAESLLAITLIFADDESYQPLDFIDEHLITLAKAAVPKTCLLMNVDCQIYEAWLESSLYETALDNTIPTEAGTLLFFSNKAAHEALNLESDSYFLLTKIPNHTLSQTDNTASTDSNSSQSNPSQLETRQHYAKNLRKIKYLLLNGTSATAPVDKRKMKTIESQNLEPIANTSTIKAITSKNNINAITDINPLKQPYDLSLFMTFIDSLVEKDILVNEHHLGHYMPSNLWLKTFISLSLLVSQANSDEQESGLSFLITKHKHDCILWLQNSSKAS